MFMKSSTDSRKISRCLIYSFLTYLAFSIDLNPVIDPGFFLKTILMNLIGSLPKFTTANIMLLPGLFLFYYYLSSKDPDRKSAALPAVLFAFSVVIGKAFSVSGGLSILFGLKSGQTLKALLIFAGYYVLALYGFAYFYDLLRARETKKEESGTGPSKFSRLSGFYVKHTFIAVTLTLFILYIPRFIISYPGQLMGDSKNQILESFPELETTTIEYYEKHLLKENVYITQLHPVAHTLLLYRFLLIGDRFFHSFNSGLFLFLLVQAAAFCSAVGFMTSFLMRYKIIRPRHILWILLYNFLYPMIHDYIFLCTKDVWYTIFMFILTAAFYMVLVSDDPRPAVPLFAAGIAGMLLFRNESRIILPLVLAVSALVYRKQRKLFLILIVPTVLVSLFIFNFLFIKLGYTPGTVREVLSIPFQQTARFVRDHGDEVTDYEKSVIGKVLNYDTIARKYNPNKSDPVKATFNMDASSGDLREYFRVWFKMFKRHPETYIQALFHNYYQFFYPDNDDKSTIYYYSYTWSQTNMDRLNSELVKIGKSFSYPQKTYPFRKFLDKLWPDLANALPFSFLLKSSFFVWMMILFLHYGIIRKKTGLITIMVLPAGIFLVCLTGPCNGYYARYLFPVIAGFPYLTAMILSFIKPESCSGE